MRGLVGAISPMLAQGGQAMAAKMAPAPAPQRRGLLEGFNPLRFEGNGMSGSERLMGIGALLADIGGGTGQNTMALQGMRREREMDALRRQQLEAQAQQAQAELTRTRYFNTTNAIVAVGPDGQSNVVYESPPEAMNTQGPIPTGMIRNPDGSLSWAPGYVDAVANVTGARRQATVNIQPPARPRAAGGGGGGTSATTNQAPRPRAARPWERYRQ